MKAYVTEFIGTFFLVLTVGLAGGAHLGPLAIGGILMAMIFMGGHISGAHYNPAVSLAVFLRGKLGKKDLIPYLLAQVAAAIFAALLVRFVFIRESLNAPAIAGKELIPALLIEFIFTFALALVILNVATAKGTSGNSFYGLAIGITIVGAAVAGGPISKGAFNPAVGIAITLMGVPIQDIWIYLIGPLAGGAAAAAVFKIQNPDG
jgi:aquaporin Z